MLTVSIKEFNQPLTTPGSRKRLEGKIKMSNLRIVEVFDGRLPEYRVIKDVSDNNSTSEVIKVFDSYEEAEQWIVERLVS